MKAFRLHIILSLLMFTSLPSICFGGVKERKDNKMFEIKFSHLPKTVPPNEVTYMEHFLVLQCFAQTLVRINEKGNITGDLAESWVFSDDGNVVTFRISDKAKFSNGDKVLPQDVINSILLHFSGENKSSVSGYLKKVVSSKSNKEYIPNVYAVGVNQVAFKLKGPYPPFLHLIAMPGFSIVKKAENKVLGSGPMNITFKDESISLEAKSDYHGEHPLIKKINITASNKSLNTVAGINEKKIDLSLGLSVEDIEASKLNEHVELTKSNSLAINHLYFNTSRNSSLKNIEVRKAIAYVFQSLAQKNENRTVLQEYSPTFIPKGVLPTDYYERSKISGPKKQTDKISVNFVTLKTIFSENLVKEAKAQLAKLNINLNFNIVEGAEFRNAMVNESYDLIGGRYIGNYPDPDGFISVIDQEMKLKYGSFDVTNFFSKLAKIRFLSDKRKRLKSYAQVLKAFEEEYKIIPLFRMNIPILHNKDLKIPESNFRYESELWRIFWQKN